MKNIQKRGKKKSTYTHTHIKKYNIWESVWRWLILSKIITMNKHNHYKYLKICLWARMLVLKWKERAFIEIANFRCICWFPAAILVHQNGAPIWRLHTKLYKGASKVSANNSETVGHQDLRFGQIVYILVFYNLHFLGHFHWTVSNLFFRCVTVKTIYCIIFVYLSKTFGETFRIAESSLLNMFDLVLLRNKAGMINVVLKTVCSHNTYHFGRQWVYYCIM